MGLKIVLSSSRRLDEKNKVIEKLKLMDKALSMLGNRGKRIEYIYDCETASTVFGLMPKQTEINNCLIPKCDWLILLAPLKHVGDKTAGELVAAYKAMKNGANLVINVFACSDPLGAKNEEEYQQNLVENDCVKADSDVYLEQLLQLLRDSYEQIDEHYVVDYRYDSDCSSLVSLTCWCWRIVSLFFVSTECRYRVMLSRQRSYIMMKIGQRKKTGLMRNFTISGRAWMSLCRIKLPKVVAL